MRFWSCFRGSQRSSVVLLAITLGRALAGHVGRAGMEDEATDLTLAVL